MSDNNTSETAEFWRDVKEARQRKRADNRAGSAELLTEAGIAFEDKNMGAHLIVNTRSGAIDFWPSTGLWIVRGQSRRSYGVRNLIKHCKDQA